MTRQPVTTPARNSAVPSGPRGDDDAHQHTFSEVGPPETVHVDDRRRVVLFDARGRPLMRRAGF